MAAIGIARGKAPGRGGLGEGVRVKVSWDKRPMPLETGIMLFIIPLIMPLLFRLFHLFFLKGRLFFEIDNNSEISTSAEIGGVELCS